MTTIEATGTSQNYYRAERATISASIAMESTDRAQSIRNATDLHNRVLERARELEQAGAATWYQAGPISTYEWSSDDGRGNRSRNFNTTSSVQVKIRDLELVSEIVAELAVQGVTTSVTWSLTGETLRGLEAKARQGAVASSRAVAGDYAAALGVNITEVLSVTDQRADFAPSPRFAMARQSFADTGLAEVTTPDIEVAATVVGTYSAS